MQKPEHSRKAARLQLALVAALFFGPLLVAAWMYYSGSFRPVARSNHGLLIEPVLPLAVTYPGTAKIAAGQWLLVYVTDRDCDDECEKALYTLQQSRLMLGNDMGRLTRVLLRGGKGTDTVFFAEQDDGPMTLHDKSLARDLAAALSGGVPHGGFFLVDPLGNLVMYFRPDLDPSEMVDDIKHLLKLSRIG
jgi:hypothetical protein